MSGTVGYYIPKIGDKVYFYGKVNLIATLIDSDGSLGLFHFEDDTKICYGLIIPNSWNVISLL